MVLIDHLVKHYFPPNINLLAYMDSPLWLDVDPIQTAVHFKGFAYQEKMKYERYNVSSVLSQECLSKYSGAEGWKCLLGMYRIPFIKTPYFMVMSQYDSYQLTLNLNKSPPYSNSEYYDYANQFAKLMRDKIEEYSKLVSSSGARNAYYSWSCYNHACSLSNCFSDGDKILGMTIKEAYSQFVLQSFNQVSHDDNATSLFWMHSCGQMNCGEGCLN